MVQMRKIVYNKTKIVYIIGINAEEIYVVCDSGSYRRGKENHRDM